MLSCTPILCPLSPCRVCFMCATSQPSPDEHFYKALKKKMPLSFPPSSCVFVYCRQRAVESIFSLSCLSSSSSLTERKLLCPCFHLHFFTTSSNRYLLWFVVSGFPPFSFRLNCHYYLYTVPFPLLTNLPFPNNPFPHTHSRSHRHVPVRVREDYGNLPHSSALMGKQPAPLWDPSFPSMVSPAAAAASARGRRVVVIDHASGACDRQSYIHAQHHMV